MILRTALSASQALELDELLWTVLWKPLGLDRDVRGKLKAQGRETVIAAEVDGRIKGKFTSQEQTWPLSSICTAQRYDILSYRR